MNLDQDSRLERVKARYQASFDHSVLRATVTAYDDCGGQTIEHELAEPGKWMVRSSLMGSRALGRAAFGFSISYEEGHTITRVVGLRVTQPGECPIPVRLFDYSTLNPPLPPPRGLVSAGYDLRVGEFSLKHPGRELRLEEFYSETKSGPDRARRVSDFRYRTRTGQYERYRTVLRRA